MAIGRSQSMRMPSRVSPERVARRGSLLSIYRSPLLQHRAHGRGVLLAVSRGQRRAIDRLAGREQRRRAADARGVFADHLHVLLPGRDAHGDVVAVVAVLDHHRRTQLEHARVAGARRDQLEDLGRIEPGLDAEHHRFGARDVVDRDQQVRDELHLHAVAEGAEVIRLPREIREHRHQALDRLRVAARVDDEVAIARLRAGAGERAVEHRVTGGAQRGLGRLLSSIENVESSAITRRGSFASTNASTVASALRASAG